MRIAVAAALLAALTASFAPPSSYAAKASSWDPVERAENASPVTVDVSGRARLYFPVSASAPLRITVAGPARLRFVSRAELPPGAAGAVSYRLRVEANGKTIGEATTASSPAPGAKRKDGKGVLCKSRTLLVEVPEGTNRLTIRAEGATNLLVRILTASPKRAPRQSMISLSPVDARGSVTVAEGELMIPYYSTEIGAPVRFRLIGPTRLELSARLDYDATMRGSQRYRLAVRISGAASREESFTTTKAIGATYKEIKDRVPSKLDRVVVQVSEGSHEVEVELLSPAGGRAQIHARIPEPSVGNEE